MTNLRDEVRGKIEKEFNDLYMGLDVDAAVTTTEIFQAIVGALPDKGNIQRYSKGSMGETLMLLSDGYDKCLANIKKLLDTKK